MYEDAGPPLLWVDCIVVGELQGAFAPKDHFPPFLCECISSCCVSVASAGIAKKKNIERKKKLLEGHQVLGVLAITWFYTMH